MVKGVLLRCATGRYIPLLSPCPLLQSARPCRSFYSLLPHCAGSKPAIGIITAIFPISSRYLRGQRVPHQVSARPQSRYRSCSAAILGWPRRGARRMSRIEGLFSLQFLPPCRLSLFFRERLRQHFLYRPEQGANCPCRLLGVLKYFGDGRKFTNLRISRCCRVLSPCANFSWTHMFQLILDKSKISLILPNHPVTDDISALLDRVFAWPRARQNTGESNGSFRKLSYTGATNKH